MDLTYKHKTLDIELTLTIFPKTWNMAVTTQLDLKILQHIVNKERHKSAT